MFGQTLYVQWKWNRDFLAFYTAAAFAAPLAILWISLPHLGLTSARELVNVGNVVGVTTAVIAVCAGLTVAWQGYGIDERVGHIYALSLPITRTRALAVRAATAAIVLTIPAVGAWFGASLAAGQVSLPPTLHAYAGSLATRALLAAWLAHACMFALRYSAGRRARGVLMGIVMLVGTLGFATVAFPATRGAITRTGDFLISNPGPFGVLFGRWTLIDV
ncbi:MAG TPA: hypothetical protein VM076_01585 [Gemmatimonadaceae bacterium]|nr:hypothetical protein [Gemmatimonadaceae bacterium]